MKTTLVSIAALVAMTFVAMADEKKDRHGILEPVPVPNGYEVRGCTYLDPTGKHVCDPKSVAQALKDGSNPGVGYFGVFTGSGAGND